MHRIIALGALIPFLIVASAASATAQAPGVEERAYNSTRGWLHGLSSTPESVRQEVLADRELIDFFADMLRGRPVSFAWDSTVVMWWVAQSGRAEFVPLFLAGVQKGRFSKLFDPSLLGLAHHLDRPDARAALRAVLVGGSPDNRISALNVLTLVNDSNAHVLMREAPRQGLTLDQRRYVDDLLSKPPLERRRVPEP